MQLTELLQPLQPVTLCGSAEVDIAGLAYDSRKVGAGFLFFALPGVVSDGHLFIPQALDNGAVAVVCEQLPEPCPAGVCFVQVENARRMMALMAASFYRDPTAAIPVIGITGTNGKTTTSYLLESILRQAGYAPAVFGTVEYRFGDMRFEAERTTPEAIDMLRMMAEFRAAGADAMILEVASHALEQYRVDGIHFELGLFTNLTPDHLDYHQHMDAYYQSKKRLFTQLLAHGKGIINADDVYGQRLLQETNGNISFGSSAAETVHPDSCQIGRDGIHGDFICAQERVRIDSSMIGQFNLSNLLAAVAAAYQMGITAEQIALGVRLAPQVPGRVERVANERGVLALVDYAHTGDALEQVLKTVTQLEHRRLICLVGCGGDRDRSKRPVMAAHAVNYAHLAILTSDNPRTEDPLAILAEMEQGAQAAAGKRLSEDEAQASDGYLVIPDRRAAIEAAARLAQAGDLILLAGKGHEDYQILGTEKIHFDDREELSRVLNSRQTEMDASDV